LLGFILVVGTSFSHLGFGYRAMRFFDSGWRESNLYKITKDEIIKTNASNNKDIESNKKVMTAYLTFNLVTFQS
jgi:hypothetical protein